ncbi:MAG TPA: hypothetical protein VM012_09140, partial [Flavitalea sp.]|nr:hypothetical protein [Flavitalea sp.]
MENKIPHLQLILLFLFCQALSFGQKPNYSGTWFLNLEKSKLEHQQKGLTGSRFVIIQDGDKFT